MARRARRGALAIAALVVAAAACGNGAAGTQTIRLVTHDSFVVSDGVLEAFEDASGHTVERLTAGDVGTMVNQAVLTKDNPLGDVLFGVDTTFLGRALDEGLFEPYESSALDTVPDSLAVGEHVTPIDFGDVCLNYDIAGLAEAGIAPPAQLMDLTRPEYAGRLVVENAATSSPGLAFLLATVATFGEDGAYTWRDFWRELVANEVVVTSGWEEAYYGEFSGGSGAGTVPIVVSYASSPPAEVIFADPRPVEAPTAVVTSGCFRQVEFAGILAGTEVSAAAGELIDFMLSLEFQEDIPLNMFVFPANKEAALPPEFIEFTEIPQQPLTLEPTVIDTNRERWIDEWTQIVLP